MRTTVNIDEASLQAAKEALGTTGLTETVNRALAEVARRARIRSIDVREFHVTDEELAAGRTPRPG